MFEPIDFDQILENLNRKRRKAVDDTACLNCTLLHCDYYTLDNKKRKKPCPNLKNKLQNPYKKLHNYVYVNLKTYGNSIIAEQTYNKLGKEKIIEDLKRNGFVDIEINSSLIVSAKYDKECDINACISSESVWRN